MLNIWIEESEQVIHRIYQISAGHPNIVQMICQAMVEELDQDPQNSSLLKPGRIQTPDPAGTPGWLAAP